MRASSSRKSTGFAMQSSAAVSPSSSAWPTTTESGLFSSWATLASSWPSALSFSPWCSASRWRSICSCTEMRSVMFQVVERLLRPAQLRLGLLLGGDVDHAADKLAALAGAARKQAQVVAQPQVPAVGASHAVLVTSVTDICNSRSTDSADGPARRARGGARVRAPRPALVAGGRATAARLARAWARTADAGDGRYRSAGSPGVTPRARRAGARGGRAPSGRCRRRRPDRSPAARAGSPGCASRAARRG